MPELKDKRVELILQQLDELPTLPVVAVRVLEATASESSSADDVVGLIQSDPALTARILQLVHRADSGIRGDVSSLDRAVSLLGFDAVRSATLAVSVFEVLQSTSAAGEQFRHDDFWKHCIAVACAAELLAAQMRENRIDPAEAFICGLLHDLGKIALNVMLPKSFSRVIEAAELLRGNIADLERQIIGLDHMVVGKRLAEKWHLPAPIRDCIWLHGQVPEALPATVSNKRLVNLVTLADQLAREQHLGYSGNFAAFLSKAALANAIGIDLKQIDEVNAKLVNEIEPRAKALGLGESSSGELYQQALRQANKELGRVSDQLATRNRKLSIRTRFFEAMSDFQSELRPDAPPREVLHAIGQTAANVLGASSCAVFSLPPGRDYAEAVLVDKDGEIFDTTMIEREPASASDSQTAPVIVRATGDGPVQPVSNAMEWLLSAISPRLGGGHRFWICLEADGVCVGGVIWGAAAGESQRLGPQAQELSALSNGWSLALRTTQIRDEARTLAEQLAEANRNLQSAEHEMLRKKTVITVGEMAAGAAHEMNNPLAVISGRSQLLASLLSDPKHKAMAHLIFDQSHRLSEIITELMDFARPVPPTIAETDVAELVNRALHEAKSLPDHADRSVEVTFGDVPPVAIDAKQVGAALMEILDNALQATAEKQNGRVELRAAFDPHSNKVVLRVIDNGCGMDETTLKRAFDPFFSAKTAGRRRGMGLPKALRWVESSGGSMRLESHVDHGSSAILLLPAIVNPAVKSAAKAAAAARESRSMIEPRREKPAMRRQA